MLELFPNFLFFGVFGLLVFVLKTTNQTHRDRTKTCSTVLETENCFQNRQTNRLIIFCGGGGERERESSAEFREEKKKNLGLFT